MQTILSLLISFLLATVTFASPIFAPRPIRRDLKDLGHSVGAIAGDLTTEPKEKLAASGWAAPSTWRGDKEWHATGSIPAPSGHMPEHKAAQWPATGAAAPTAHMFKHPGPMMPMSTGTGMPLKHANASFPTHKMPRGTGSPDKVMITTSSMPMATGMPHKKLRTNGTAGIWPSGAVLPSGASWPSGAAWPSSRKAFTFSTSSAPFATGRKPDMKLNATRAFATGTAVPTPKTFSTGTAPSAKFPANATTPSFPTGTAPAVKSIKFATAPVSDFHPKISASSFLMHAPSTGLPAAKAPTSTGQFPVSHMKAPFAAPKATAPASDIKALTPTSVKEFPHSHLEMPTAPAMVIMHTEASSSSAAPSITESVAAPSATHFSFHHSAETKSVVHKSPGAPCSADDKMECKGESMYGACEYTDGHWRWYWTDVQDGHFCKDGAVHKDSSDFSGSFWDSSTSHGWSKRLDSVFDMLHSKA